VFSKSIPRIAAQACTNPSPVPAGYAAPCPVFSLSAASVSQTGTFTLSATPQAGTDYIYTTAYISQGTTWNPYTLSGNNAAPSYSSSLASLTLSSTQLQALSLGTHYTAVWNWLWDATPQCYKGPGLNQCNTGTWRVQSFVLTANPTPSPSAVSAPPPTENDVFIISDDGTMLNTDGSVNDLPIAKAFYRNHSDAYDFLVIFTNAAPRGNDFYTQIKNDVSGIGRAIVDNSALFGSAGKLRGIAEMSSIDVANENTNHTTYFWLAHELGHAWLMSLTTLPSGTHLDDSFYHFWRGLLSSDRYADIRIFNDSRMLDHRNGTYSIIRYSADHMAQFHPLALYLMGLIPRPTSDGPPYIWKLISNQLAYVIPTNSYYEDGILVGSQFTFTATSELVTVSDIIAAAGAARTPSYTSSPKTFTVGYLLVTKPGTTPTAVEISRLNAIDQTFPQKWAYATQGKSTIASAVQVPATRLVFTSPAQTVPQRTCSGKANVQAQDANGNPVTLAALTPIRISGTPIAPQLFSDPSCTATSTQLAIPSGANSTSFYFKVAMDGADTLAAYAAGFQAGTQTETIQIYPRSKFSFLTAPQIIAAGRCSSKATIQLQGSDSLPITLGIR
jgi:hypothetical protein